LIKARLFFWRGKKVCEKYEEMMESERLKRWNEKVEGREQD